MAQGKFVRKNGMGVLPNPVFICEPFYERKWMISVETANGLTKYIKSCTDEYFENYFQPLDQEAADLLDNFNLPT